MFKHELYNRAGDGNRVRTLNSILFYVIYFNLFVECFGCLRFFQIDWQSQPSPWTLVDKCSCSNARFSNSMDLLSQSYTISNLDLDPNDRLPMQLQNSVLILLNHSKIKRLPWQHFLISPKHLIRLTMTS